MTPKTLWTGGNIMAPSPVLSPTSTLVDSSPQAPLRQRPPLARVASADDGSRRKREGENNLTEASTNRAADPGPGLGISFDTNTGYSHHFYTSSVDTSNDRTAEKGGGRIYEREISSWSSENLPKQSVTSLQSTFPQSPFPSSDTQPLRGNERTSTYHDYSPRRTGPPQGTFHYGCSSWRFVTMIMLSVYSTVFSLIYLIIAARAPRYGKLIGTHGTLTVANASLLTALVAKSIELTFATVFVAFIGQVLWRRAFLRPGNSGVTLAEMDMRSWVTQPGAMITRFGALRSSALSLLGVLTVIAAMVAMLYTTASEALVQPQLRFGKWQSKLMLGSIKSSVFNTAYIQQKCASPTTDFDPAYGGTTCTQIEYAAQSYYNYQRFLSDWSEFAKVNGSSVLADRPQGFALVTENTTVTAQWIENVDNGMSLIDGRIVNNISMAMPHAGVPAAARGSVNGILQPEDLDGLGLYTLRASVPSPAVNVLCANMQKDELEPIVYDMWGEGGGFNPSTWLSDQIATVGPELIKNKTVVDDIFGWGDKYGQAPPVLPRLPIDYNTVLNQTAPYGRNAMYLLGKGSGPDYLLCAIQAYLTPNCSTSYNASSNGAKMEVVCEDETDAMRYINNTKNAPSGNETVSKDWFDISSEWGNSLSLDAGLSDGNASNARLLTQLILESSLSPKELSSILPSPAEALAVLAGCTLLMGTQDTPFVEFWNYSKAEAPKNILSTPQYQSFNATLRAQEYASGGSKGYQHGFFVVLIFVCILNTISLVYFLYQRSMITDFSEPLNMFSLAVNSPPSDIMAGTGRSGPAGRHYKVPWYVSTDGHDLYLENRNIKDEEGHEMATRRSGIQTDGPSPVRRAYERFSKLPSRSLF